MKRDEYTNALRLLKQWQRRRALALTKVDYYYAKIRRYENALKKETDYQVYLPHVGTHHVNVYVIEIDQAEVIKRRCLNGKTEVKSIRDSLILRYWKLNDKRVNYTGKARNSEGHKLERRAYELIGQLKIAQAGAKNLYPPNFEKEGRSNDGYKPTTEDKIDAGREG